MINNQLRIVDANFNRAREALRVIEDYARFVLDDTYLTGLAKQLRHDLCDCINQLPTPRPITERDILGDVGTSIATDAEKQRLDALMVVTAATRRLTEALRSLEEYCKIESSQIGEKLESLRYRAYDLEKRVILRAKPVKQFIDVRLYVIITENLCRKAVLEVVREVLAGGADCIQLREKDKSDRQILDLGSQIAGLCHESKALFIMNDRPDLAVLAGADGVHLGQDDLTINQARKIILSRMIVGKSAHNLSEARLALDEDPDYLAVGSIFASGTKPDVSVAGTELIQEVKKLYNGPIIAIGGITPDNAQMAIAAGASGIAVCQAVLGVDSPKTACRNIRQKLPPT